MRLLFFAFIFLSGSCFAASDSCLKSLQKIKKSYAEARRLENEAIRYGYSIETGRIESSAQDAEFAKKLLELSETTDQITDKNEAGFVKDCLK